MRYLMLISMIFNLNFAFGFGPPKHQEVEITSNMIKEIAQTSGSGVTIKKNYKTNAVEVSIAGKNAFNLFQSLEVKPVYKSSSFRYKKTKEALCMQNKLEYICILYVNNKQDRLLDSKKKNACKQVESALRDYSNVVRECNESKKQTQSSVVAQQ